MIISIDEKAIEEANRRYFEQLGGFDLFKYKENVEKKEEKEQTEYINKLGERK